MLRVRWLGRVRHRDAHALQRALMASGDDYLVLLEHPHVYTLGVRGSSAHLLVAPEDLGAELVTTDRGGDVTYHGPGQLVGYPVLTVPVAPGSTPAHVAAVEQVVIDTCKDLGLGDVGRIAGLPGVWVAPESQVPRKVCAVGVRNCRGRTMHGFALNVDPDLARFGRIIPCGLVDKAVTSLAAEGVHATMADVVDAVVARAARQWGKGGEIERAGVAWPSGADVLPPGGAGEGMAIGPRKPQWLRAPVEMGPDFLRTRSTMRDLSLVTVCEEAGCPNIFECWRDGTATFMINGDRCTRACGFCLVDTSRPLPIDPDEPEHVAEAVARMGLAHAVVTAVARDDLPDGGAEAFARVIASIRRRCPSTAVEVLVPDCKGDPESLERVFVARPDVFNHNLETVARLQRRVRPSAGYARSLAVLARAAAAGLVTKSGLMVGLGETKSEVVSAMTDLGNVGVSILTIGQYLQPSATHLPVSRWWHPDELQALADHGRRLGFAHVEASPLARSSYHARAAAASAAVAAPS